MLCVLFRPGQIQWEGVQDMVCVMNQGQSSSQDAAKILKQYLRTNSPVVVLKALTVRQSTFAEPECALDDGPRSWIAW